MAAPIGLGDGGENGWLFAVTQEQGAAPFNQSTDSRQHCSKIRNKIRPKSGRVVDDWWAFIKACFCKKNRTLGATFKQKKKVMEPLGMSNLAGSNGESKDYISSSDNDNDNDEGKSDEEEFSPSSCSEIGASSFKEKLIGVLKSGNFEDKRPSKLSNEELLHLLAMFNQEGVYFHDHS